MIILLLLLAPLNPQQYIMFHISILFWTCKSIINVFLVFFLLIIPIPNVVLKLEFENENKYSKYVILLVTSYDQVVEILTAADK